MNSEFVRGGLNVGITVCAPFGQSCGYADQVLIRGRRRSVAGSGVSSPKCNLGLAATPLTHTLKLERFLRSLLLLMLPPVPAVFTQIPGEVEIFWSAAE